MDEGENELPSDSLAMAVAGLFIATVMRID